jgi:predicted TPR repeat methyltransferase
VIREVDEVVDGGLGGAFRAWSVRKPIVIAAADVFVYIGDLQPLFVSALFLAVHGIVQVALLVKVQHDAVARLEQARRAARHAFVAHDAEVARANFIVGLRGFSGLHGWLGYYVG